MKGKVTFNKNGNGSASGRVIIPKAFLEILRLDKSNREVNITLEDNKIIIEKVENNMKNLVGKTWGEIPEEQKEELLSIANAVDGRTVEKAKEGDCIVDFKGYDFSIPGKVIIGEYEDTIEIDNNAKFYKSI